MALHTEAIVFGAIIFGGYNIMSTVLQVVYYMLRQSDAEAWKTQPKLRGSFAAHSWWLPLLQTKPNRGPHHALYTTLNLTLSAIIGAFAVECMYRGWTLADVHAERSYLWTAVTATVAVVHQCVAEYFWHLLMHLPWFYKRFHKIHHFYKSPEPFDDMYIHPLESVGYQLILFSPPFLIPMTLPACIIYMLIMGVFGITDHSGIKFAIPSFYNSADHDAHHRLTEVNYAFPFPYMDILFGTFTGECFGKHYERSPRNRERVGELGPYTAWGLALRVAFAFFLVFLLRKASEVALQTWG